MGRTDAMDLVVGLAKPSAPAAYGLVEPVSIRGHASSISLLGPAHPPSKGSGPAAEVVSLKQRKALPPPQRSILYGRKDGLEDASAMVLQNAAGGVGRLAGSLVDVLEPDKMTM